MTPKTYGQARRLVELVDEVTESSAQVQNLIGAGDLLKMLAQVNTHSIDRTTFRTFLASAVLKPIDWTPVSRYAVKLLEWQQRFGLGLTAEDIIYALADLPDHAGPHLPTRIKLFLGKGVQHDWEMVTKILKYEVEKLGVPFEVKHFCGSYPWHLSRKKPGNGNKIELSATLLDIGEFWHPQDPVEPREALCYQGSRDWPGLEVAWLLALNPQVFLAMDGKTVPSMWAIGLVHDGGYLYFNAGPQEEAFVTSDWGDYGVSGGKPWASVVAFRE
jgi:hypothetical protein